MTVISSLESYNILVVVESRISSCVRFVICDMILIFFLVPPARYRLTALKKHGFCFEGKMAVLDVCETNVRIERVPFRLGKWRMGGYSALITVSSH
jgi:hypothetical protein